MSDPRHDPNRDRPSMDTGTRGRNRFSQPYEAPNVMIWGWIAGLAILALIVVFLFASNETSRVAGPAEQPGATQSTQTPAPQPQPQPPSTAQRPATPPATTGSGSGNQ